MPKPARFLDDSACDLLDQAGEIIEKVSLEIGLGNSGRENRSDRMLAYSIKDQLRIALTAIWNARNTMA